MYNINSSFRKKDDKIRFWFDVKIVQEKLTGIAGKRSKLYNQSQTKNDLNILKYLAHELVFISEYNITFKTAMQMLFYWCL